MDYQPPPFFKRGPAPLAQLSFYAALSLALIFIDSRFQTLEILRQGVSLITHPIQRVVQKPVEMLQNAAGYLSGMDSLREQNSRLERTHVENATTLLRAQHLEAENERLRQLLEVKESKKAQGRVAQLLYTVRDPYSRRIVVDKGQQDNIVPGQPVVDEKGVIGQVTRVFPYVSEVTLITDKDQVVPVQILRNGLRSVVFGVGNGRLELRFLPNNADVEKGDLIVTSGLDGIFLPGLAVARVVSVERDASYSFARIHCEPLAGVENFGLVMVLDPREPLDLPGELTEKASKSKPADGRGKAAARNERPRKE
ncbi:rod shape-determining protein MreC [Propionivibrio limicola]|uniref:rod shape-determining protein MreC n=1 Tax=Propionivibrio limicola TaxID=167645 RepID=UPI0012925029|nr:rod shape-determining protein MreC [Propionivibrio limicola]